MQFLGFGEVTDVAALVKSLEESGMDAALYEDINDARRGRVLLTFSEDPNFFIDSLRPFLHRPPFAALLPKPEYTMLGRTYALGYEPDLDETLVDRPWRKAIDPANRWSVRYPLRRSGSFEQLNVEEQTAILREHGTIGMAYGRAGRAQTSVWPATAWKRQRLRGGPAGRRTLPPLHHCPDNAQNQADLPAPGTAGTVLCGPARLAEQKEPCIDPHTQ